MQKTPNVPLSEQTNTVDRSTEFGKFQPKNWHMSFLISDLLNIILISTSGDALQIREALCDQRGDAAPVLRVPLLEVLYSKFISFSISLQYMHLRVGVCSLCCIDST